MDKTNTYKRVQIGDKNKLSHRVIMEEYLGRELTRNEYVHHINGNKQDNRIENLVVLSPQEHNRLHFEKLPKKRVCVVCGKEFEPPVKHRGRNKICSKECWFIWQKQNTPFKNKKICQYDKNGCFIKEFSSILEASNEVSGTSSNIVKCAKGKTKTAYGFIWKYK